MRTANPALSDKAFFGQTLALPASDVMTLEGTVNKTVLAVALTVIAAIFSWSNPGMVRFALPLVLGTFVVSLVIVFKQSWAPVLTPVYAIGEGLFLGSISLIFNQRAPGIALQAVTLTFGTLFCLLLAYKSGTIRATENFKLGVVAATGAIFFLYLISSILGFFGVQMSFLHDSSPVSIGISGVIVVVAALNLVLDFDFIETAAARGTSPKYMEWYGAFGLLVTLVWLYLEILRLLSKLQRR